MIDGGESIQFFVTDSQSAVIGFKKSTKGTKGFSEGLPRRQTSRTSWHSHPPATFSAFCIYITSSIPSSSSSIFSSDTFESPGIYKGSLTACSFIPLTRTNHLTPPRNIMLCRSATTVTCDDDEDGIVLTEVFTGHMFTICFFEGKEWG